MTSPLSDAESKASGTRLKLLATAEELFANEGVKAVSLRRITKQAGQLNASALHYHFGSRDDLIAAILEKRMGVVNKRRLAYLERLQSEGREKEVRALCEVLVYPLASMLKGEDGAPNYVRFLASVFLSTEVNAFALTKGKEDHSLRILANLFLEALPELPVRLVRMRYTVVVRQVIFALADWKDGHAAGSFARFTSLEAYVENLIDMSCAAMRAPVSPSTEKAF
ncbi:MAG: TetR family transcriptional regulator [Ectothiorhodospiraceae bacterium]|nr:TetR family transcriptional regulator [Ectothiorhodospiraceae bacterium]